MSSIISVVFLFDGLLILHNGLAQR